MKTVLKMAAIGALLLFGLVLGLLVMLRATDGALAANMVCGQAQALMDGFRMKYGETPIWRGQTGVGTVGVILASPSGTWTALQIKDDMACAVASGDKAEMAEPGEPA